MPITVLSHEQQMIVHVHEINSKKEMHSYVRQFAEGNITF